MNTAFDPLSEVFVLSPFQRSVIQGIKDHVGFWRFMNTSIPRRAMNQEARRIYVSWQDKQKQGYTAYLETDRVRFAPNGWPLRLPEETSFDLPQTAGRMRILTDAEAEEEFSFGPNRNKSMPKPFIPAGGKETVDPRTYPRAETDPHNALMSKRGLHPQYGRAMVRTIRQNAELCSSHLEELISMVPTGELRNQLTEANIHLHAARQVLKAAQESIQD